MPANDIDQRMRQAAFLEVRRRAELRDQLTSEDLALGFQFEGRRYPLVNPQRGIFKPREMAGLLSIRTVVPRSGARVWYDDQREAHQQIYAGDEFVDYAFTGKNPDAAENRWLRDAMVNRTPIIYFLGTAPGERLGQPIITNGIPLSKLHHAAFDAHLIGVSPDYRVVVSDRLLAVRDGPTLEALKQLNGNLINFPRRMQDRPDRERLAMRFEEFRKGA
jgi:hypothetical protein